MKKIIVFFALFCAMVLMIGCDNSDSFDSETSDNGGNGGNGSSGSSDAGIHLGIIGFNEELDILKINLLKSNLSSYTSFINSLSQKDGTALYYADYTALKMMNNYPKPPELEKVALITFTDGIDNFSADEFDPEKYGEDHYLDALHNKIVNEKIHGLPVEAYTIGLETVEIGNDAADFETTLQKLASNENYKFKGSDMEKVKKRFKEIADSLSYTSTKVNLIIKLAQGYHDTDLMRFTFDIECIREPGNTICDKAYNDSQRYIEATYRKTDNGRTLEGVTYKGFVKGKTTIPSFKKVGGFYYFEFEDLRYDDGTQPKWTKEFLEKMLTLWKNGTTDIEFTPTDGTDLDKHQSSALIMLTLDCTTSLGGNFRPMKEAAEEFVRTLANAGSNTGDSSSGDTGTSDTGSDFGDTGSDIGDTIGDGCETENQGRACTTDTECGNCMICTTGGKCSKGCITDADCTMQTGLHCNTKLARCLSIYASNKACSEVNCPTGCCYAEKGLTGLRCASQASPATCGLCAQGEIWSPSDSKCISAVCSATTDNCPSLNIGATNPSAACYKCKSGELICQANTTQSGCSASGVIINAAQCIPSGQQCVEGVSECCSGMPCIDGYCY